MANAYTLLVLEDEPLIMMDLQFSGEDRECDMLCASNCNEAMEQIANAGAIDAAILDVSLGQGETCLPIARELNRRGIPFILHSGDLDRHDEKIRTLNAELLAKPLPSEAVIAAAIACAQNNNDAVADYNQLNEAAE